MLPGRLFVRVAVRSSLLRRPAAVVRHRRSHSGWHLRPALRPWVLLGVESLDISGRAPRPPEGIDLTQGILKFCLSDSHFPIIACIRTGGWRTLADLRDCSVDGVAFRLWGTVEVFRCRQRAGSRSRTFLARRRRSVEIRDKPCRVEADGVRQIEELDHVDAPLASLDPRDVSLPPSEAVRQRRLGQVRVLPRLRQKLTELRVLAREERLRPATSSEPHTQYSKIDLSSVSQPNTLTPTIAKHGPARRRAAMDGSWFLKDGSWFLIGVYIFSGICVLAATKREDWVQLLKHPMKTLSTNNASNNMLSIVFWLAICASFGTAVKYGIASIVGPPYVMPTMLVVMAAIWGVFEAIQQRRRK
jgi:hypothetical protein